MYTFKMVTVVNVMLFEFNLNFKKKKTLLGPTKMCCQPKVRQLCFKWRKYCL